MIGCRVEKNSASGMRDEGDQVAPGDGEDVGEHPAQAVARGAGAAWWAAATVGHAASLPSASVSASLAAVSPLARAGAPARPRSRPRTCAR